MICPKLSEEQREFFKKRPKKGKNQKQVKLPRPPVRDADMLPDVYRAIFKGGEQARYSSSQRAAEDFIESFSFTRD